MATLEIHDGRGNVEYVTISHDHTALIGSDPKSDIVLKDPNILPFHARLRWKGGKFKAEAFPEAGSIEVNGKRVVAASFRQGDEIRIGQHRIFLQKIDDLATPKTDDKTVVQAPPGRPSAIAPAGARGSPSTSAAASASQSITLPPIPKNWGWIDQFLAYLNAREQIPGQEKLTSSPLVLGLALALVTLALGAVGMWLVISERAANNAFQFAQDNMQARDYAEAIRSWENFLRNHPTDPRAGKARVQRAMATVLQFAGPGANANYSLAIDAAREAFSNLEGEPDFEEARAELAGIVLRCAEELADLATAGADRTYLDRAQGSLTLHDKLAGDSAVEIRGKSALPKKLEAARASVRKRDTREAAVAAMDAAVKARAATQVYALRDTLIAEYPDLAPDRDVLKHLSSANDLVRQAVQIDLSAKPPLSTPESEILAPPLSFVVHQPPSQELENLPAPAAPTTPAPSTAAQAPPVYALVDGLLYALDGLTGAPLWQREIGLSAPFSPLSIPGDEPSLLICRGDRNELLRIDGRTGKTLWRQDLGESVADPPLILGNQAIQVVPSGKVYLISIPTGQIRGMVNLGQPGTRMPAADESGQYLYVLGDKDCVFILQRDPLQCVGVEYLGHARGSIGFAPARVGPYLVVPENRELWQGRWTIYQIEKDGVALRQRQSVPIPGWTWNPPVGQGSVVWSASDRGAVAAFVVNPPDAPQPLRQLATTLPDARPFGPAHARARSERELWLSSHRAVRFNLSPNQDAIEVGWAYEEVGPAVAPIQSVDRLAILTHRDPDGQGVSLMAIEPVRGRQVWKTTLGKPWPVSLSPHIPSNDALITHAPDGATLSLPADALSKGGFITVPPPRPGYFALPGSALPLVQNQDQAVIIPAPDAEYLLARKAAEPIRRIDLPAPIGTTPLFWGTDLIVPGNDGRVDLIDPSTAAPRAEPYVPPFDRSKPLRWLVPVRLGQDSIILADVSGRVRRLGRRADPRPRLAPVGEEINLGSPVIAPPAATDHAVILVTADRKIRSLSGDDLSALGAWNLEAPLALQPLAAGGHVFVCDIAGRVSAFAPDGQRLWETDLQKEPPAGPPVVKDDLVWFLSRSGLLERRHLADGSALEPIDLGIMPAGGLSLLGSKLVIPTARGTIRLLDTANASPTASGTPER
jgi:pSer/pThr/pTyr-binding forkhead associated (FHA) protein